MHASGSDMAVQSTRLKTDPRAMPRVDQLVEVTPESIRIRKGILDYSQREVAAKKAQKATV